MFLQKFMYFCNQFPVHPNNHLSSKDATRIHQYKTIHHQKGNGANLIFNMYAGRTDLRGLRTRSG